MNNDETFDKWLTQLRKGFLELCVLTLLHARGKAYGLELLQLLERAGLAVNEGTLYPLLNRMYKHGWLESNWETPTGSGHPRRFYTLSALGERQLPRMSASLREHVSALQLLETLT